MTRIQSGRPALVLAFGGLLCLIAALIWFVQHDSGPARVDPAATTVLEPRTPPAAEDLELRQPTANSAASPGVRAETAAPNAAARATPSTASLHASSRDARSGASIPGMRLEFVEDVSAPEQARITHVRADRDGVVEREGFPAGRWRVTASAARYRSQQLGSLETLPERRLDLGRITLEPLPTHRGILRDENGKPAASQWITLPFQSRPEERVDPTVTNDVGQFELLGDLPATVVLQVNPPEPLRSLAAQRFQVDRWDPDMLLELQLAAYQHVILKLYDAPAGDEHLHLDVYPDDDRQVPLLRARELPPDLDARRFEFYAAAGKLRVWGGSASIRFPLTRLEWVEGTADPEFVIRAR